MSTTSPEPPAAHEDLAPALIVSPRREDFRRQSRRSMGPPDVYGGQDGIATVQRLLLDGCQDIRSARAAPAEHGHPAHTVTLAQLTLHEARVAKSYRPVETFTQETCPVIGETDGLGKFLVLVTPDGLKHLEQRIAAPASATAAAHLTSIAALSPLDVHYRLTLPMEHAIRRQLQRDGAVRVKVRLPRFELFTPLYQAELEATFLGMEGIHEAPYLMLGNFLIYGADVTDFEQVARFAELPFIDRVEVMPRYRPVQFAFASDGTEPPGPAVRLGPIPDDLPTVVVADTGVARDGPLAPLVRERASFVTGPDDPAHGTAVAALATAQRDALAAGLLIPRTAIVDARIFAADDEEVLEEEMIPRIEAAVRRFGPTHKVWNDSIASVPGPRPQRYSELGQRFDELRHEYDLMVVSAAGNRLLADPRIAFPPVTEDDDWIYAPGDSLRNVTATSLAPEGAPPDAYARPHEPSPFAGRGLSPAGALLPLVAEYGGNVTRSGEPVGVLTIDVSGRLCLIAGSSMTAPPIAGTLAELAQCFGRSLAQETPVSDLDPLLLSKAALLHHAAIPPILSGDANVAEFFGFGVPPALEELTGDPAWRGTTLIATTLAPNGDDLVIDPYPFPEGLRLEDFHRGDIQVTLVTEPLLVSGETLEYVRSDVELQFGPACNDADGELHIKPNQLVLDARYPAARFETELIKREQKWSPFRRYHVRLTGAGIRADRWALRAHLRLRAEESELLRAARDDRHHPHRFLDLVELHRVQTVIAVTILDPQHEVRVRDQLLQQWQLRGNIPTQIAVAQRIRSRFTL